MNKTLKNNNIFHDPSSLNEEDGSTLFQSLETENIEYCSNNSPSGDGGKMNSSKASPSGEEGKMNASNNSPSGDGGKMNSSKNSPLGDGGKMNFSKASPLGGYIIGGGNNDIDRMQEIKERSLQYEGLKHYFLIRFAQRPGALKAFVNHVLGPNDDITRFEYIQKHNKETGPALVGIELRSKLDYDALLQNLNQYHINFTELSKNDNVFGYLV